MSAIAELKIDKYVPIRKQAKPLKQKACKENCLKCKRESKH